MHPASRMYIVAGLLALIILPAWANEENGTKDSVADTTAAAEVLAGHSYHGEAFNEGPRQGAVLIEGMGTVAFPVSAKNEEAAQFFQQGVAALHGFWYLEAERSFRQAVKIEPDLAIAYWGMAMANLNNEKRAKGMIDEAVKGREQASKYEKLYIDAFSKYLANVGDDEKDKEDNKKEDRIKREKQLIKDLEKLLDNYPEDIEAKAFLCFEFGKPVASTFRYPVTTR